LEVHGIFALWIPAKDELVAVAFAQASSLNKPPNKKQKLARAIDEDSTDARKFSYHMLATIFLRKCVLKW
jgi:hypothetical protein